MTSINIGKKMEKYLIEVDAFFLSGKKAETSRVQSATGWSGAWQGPGRPLKYWLIEL
jgi:hypothetical protein